MFLSDDEVSQRLNSDENLLHKVEAYNQLSQDEAKVTRIINKDESSELTQEDTNFELNELVRGRPPGSPTSPIELKKLAAALMEAGESPKSVSQITGFPLQLLNEIKHGRTSLGNPSSELKEVQSRIRTHKVEAEDKAIKALLLSLDTLQETAPKVKNASKLAVLAKNLSYIAKNMRTESENEIKKSVHLHIFAPKQLAVEDYEVVDAS